MHGFDPEFRDFPDYLRKLARRLWSQRGLGAGQDLGRYWHPHAILRSPEGIGFGPDALRAEVFALVSALPDLEALTEEALATGAPRRGLLGAQRLLCTGIHDGAGVFGAPTGRRLRFRALSEVHAKDNRVAELWMVRDTGAMLRQIGLSVQEWARWRLGCRDPECQPFRPEVDVQGPYTGQGDDSQWGAALAALLQEMMAGGFSVAPARYDPAARLCLSGGELLRGAGGAERFWLGLRAAFPSACFTIHHAIGVEAQGMPPRAALRWSLSGRHDGWGRFGPPSGAEVHVMGLSQAEFGPRGLCREWSLYDEAAVWMQIHLGAGRAGAGQATATG
ncbi:ester cyclase [Salipiger mangrovisoli]|uniref:Ester cyclase n=1 Tax=Salipiger mangrovisoli TaxID=2865933 RepID=A0ABR9X8B7_9RHOB|nr:ester cyclase [Salipiger mangrovisoli]MBE9639749.1 ester cyclase [Salipiger mangrovisoli]